MNPQKLAGQCAKLKCCLNFEVDTYMEASHALPHRDIRSKHRMPRIIILNLIYWAAS